jgi:hypothetical protein
MVLPKGVLDDAALLPRLPLLLPLLLLLLLLPTDFAHMHAGDRPDG